MKLNTRTNLIILATLIVLAGAWWFFFSGGGNDTPITTATTGSAAQAQFKSLIGELAPITFDTGILSDARFGVLVNLATPVSPESTGRSDPFASIGSAK